MTLADLDRVIEALHRASSVLDPSDGEEPLDAANHVSHALDLLRKMRKRAFEITRHDGKAKGILITSPPEDE